MENTITWDSIFENLPWYDKKYENDYTVESLLAANGHSVSKTAKYTLNSWENTIDEIKKNLDYDEIKKYDIMEVGCGAGAVLKYFENNNNIYGIEPSKTYFDIISNAIKNGKFFHGDALNLNQYEDNQFDIILCYSTIQFFPDLNYFKTFADLCYKKLKIGGKLFIGDILNKDLEEKYRDFRIKRMGYEEYKKNYIDTNLKHLYISKNELSDIMVNFNLYNFSESEKRGEEEIAYRFNIYCSKK